MILINKKNLLNSFKFKKKLNFGTHNNYDWYMTNVYHFEKFSEYKFIIINKKNGGLVTNFFYGSKVDRISDMAHDLIHNLS
jgi:hypothetical protein